MTNEISKAEKINLVNIFIGGLKRTMLNAVENNHSLTVESMPIMSEYVPEPHELNKPVGEVFTVRINYNG